MNFKLYSTMDNENVINKDLVLKYEANIKLKDTMNISSPTILLQDVEGVEIINCNYCFISDFNRFYFIKDIEVKNNINTLYLECDVLESFKNDILNSFSEFSRNVETGDFLEVKTVSDLRKEIDIFNSNVTIEKKKNIVLTTIGGV